MSAQIDDGGPAFPVPLLPGEAWAGNGTANGMTLRDWFAGQALTSALSAAKGLGDAGKDERRALFNSVASILYEMADAMIEARKGGER